MRVGVGYSDIPDSALAGQHAARGALAQIGIGAPCDMVLLFCTSRHNPVTLRDAVAHVVGAKVPIYGGGAVGVMTNETFGYAGDQVGVACFRLDGVRCDVLTEPGLAQSEEQTGMRLGERLLAAGTTPQTPLMLFYDAVYQSEEGMRLLMATWLLKGLEDGLSFSPHLSGAGMQGDHIATPTMQFAGHEITQHSAMAMAFHGGISMDTAILHGCRPATDYFTVTRAEGPVILEINGVPAIAFMDELLGPAIKPSDYPFFLLFGINHGDKWGEYDEKNYASRLCLGIDEARSGIVMFEPDMVAGTQFQLMFRSLDLDYIAPKIEAVFDRLEGREPVFAMYIDCAGRCAGYGGLDLEDAVVLQQAVRNRAPLLGLYTGVEIAEMDGHPRGLDWTGVFCLFSKRKDGSVSRLPDSPQASWMHTEGANDPAETPIEAMRNLAEQNAAKILALDTQTIRTRYELEQKRRGFELLASLAVSLRNKTDYAEMFAVVAQRINAALNMQKTLVLSETSAGRYTPAMMRGFTPEETARLADFYLLKGDELLDPNKPVIVTGADSPERFAALRSALNLPHLIAAPVILKQKTALVLITGRMAEQPPYLSRLNMGDLETLQAIGELLAAVLVREQLDEAEERAHIMMDAMPLCATFWDENLRVIDCNLAALKLFGLPDKQSYCKRFHELSPLYQPTGELSAKMAAARLKEAFREGYLVFEWMHQDPEGQPLPVEVTLVRMKHKGEDVLIGYTRDMRELRAKMEVIEHTQEALRIALNRAEESSRAKTNFLSNMSHEIRTPMNAIIGMSSIAKSATDPKEINQCLTKIGDASQHLLGIINDVLDMSKIDAGKFTLSMSECALSEILDRIVSMIGHSAGEKGQKFSLDMGDDVPGFIITDQQRLVQVIMNLLSNAVKFTPDGGNIGLLVAKTAEEDAHCTLQFTITDTGIGITSEQKTRLFQPFSQADNSISRRFGGTGLGLAISKDIVGLMGGEIWVESQPQKGSSFHFTIRAQKGSAASAADWESETSATDPQVRDGLFAGKRVLLVEDVEINREILIALLSNTGLAIDEAENGRIGCEMFLAHPGRYDAIFMDIHMPEMDGYETARAIRTMDMPHAATVPIIAMTANVFREDIERCLASGMNDHIGKPLDIGEVIRKLSTHLFAFGDS